MYTSDVEHLPKSGESLAEYVRRIRTGLALSQKEVADRATLHLQSLGKIERGQTTRLNQKTRVALSGALEISPEYLDAAVRGTPLVASAALKYCPNCWVAGSVPEPIWLDVRSRFCFLCGEALRNRCIACNEPVISLKFRFCPHCGTAYKTIRHPAREYSS